MGRRDPEGLAARLSTLSFQHGEALARASTDADAVEALVTAEHFLRGYMAGLQAREPSELCVCGAGENGACWSHEVTTVRSLVLRALADLVPDFHELREPGSCRGCGGVLERAAGEGARCCAACFDALELGVVFPWFDPRE